MGGVIAISEPVHEVGGVGRDRHGQLEAPVDVAEVGADLLLEVLPHIPAGHVRRHLHRRLPAAQLRTQLSRRVAGQPGQRRGQVLGLGVVEAAHERDAAVHPLVGDDRAVGGDQSGVRRDDHPVHPQAAGDLGGVQRSGAPVGDQVELPVVQAAVDGHQPHGAVHVLDGDRHDGVGRVLDGQAQPVGQRPGSPARPVRVEAHLPAEEVLRVQSAHEHVGVGDRRLLPAEPVARRSRIGARALRADLQQATRVDGRDGAPAGTDRRHVQDRQRQRQSELHFEQARELQLAVGDNTHVGAGAAHVQRHRLVGAHGAGEVRAGDHPGGEARQHDLHRPVGGVGDRNLPAVGPQQTVPAAHVHLSQLGGE